MKERHDKKEKWDGGGRGGGGGPLPRPLIYLLLLFLLALQAFARPSYSRKENDCFTGLIPHAKAPTVKVEE